MIFNPGDKIMCVDPGPNEVTKGEVYVVIKSWHEESIEFGDSADDWVKLLSDDGHEIECYSSRFVIVNQKELL